MRGLRWLCMSVIFAAIVLSGGLEPAWLGRLFVDAGGVVILTYPIWPYFRRNGRGRRGV